MDGEAGSPSQGQGNRQWVRSGWRGRIKEATPTRGFIAYHARSHIITHLDDAFRNALPRMGHRGDGGGAIRSQRHPIQVVLAGDCMMCMGEGASSERASWGVADASMGR